MNKNRIRKIKHVIAKIIRTIGYLVAGAIGIFFLVLLVLVILSNPLKALLVSIGYIVSFVLIGLTYFGFTALLDWLEK